MVEAIGGTLGVPHMDDNRMHAYLRRHLQVESTEVLEGSHGKGYRLKYGREAI